MGQKPQVCAIDYTKVLAIESDIRYNNTIQYILTAEGAWAMQHAAFNNNKQTNRISQATRVQTAFPRLFPRLVVPWETPPLEV